MITAVFSFVSIIIGASLQYIFTRYLDNQKHHRNLRTQAYMDYLKCVCDQANLIVQPQAPLVREILAKTIDAKARICLYGSAKVVQAFAKFEELGCRMVSVQERTTFVKMVLEMRTDSGTTSIPQIEDLVKILFGDHAKTLLNKDI